MLAGPARQVFENRLSILYRRYFTGIAASAEHIDQMVLDSLDVERSKAQLELLSKSLGKSLHGLKVLEVGSGVGLTVATARLILGAESYGIEPGTAEYDGTLAVGQDLLQSCGIDPAVLRQGVGEDLPYPDQSFDAVISSNVLEHVQDPQRVISEMVRVLRPGGTLQIIVPNYGSWWEGHYGILWLPHMPAWLGKIYVRLLGRDPAFIDTLQLVTRGRMECWLAPHRDNLDVLGWGVDLWEERVRDLGFGEYSALGRLKTILRWLHRLRIVPLVIILGKALHWETPFVLTAWKRE